ncbi:MAG TPA: threonine ammonia-lyase [Allosphingosinicella sp.]|jgi:threonine dehydratase
MARSAATISDLPVALADVQAAAGRIEGAVMRTPFLLSSTLSERTGATVYVKLENMQFTGAYKERGALNRLLLMAQDQRERGVIAASAGNHAQALAYHARRLGIPATIVMPAPTPSVKVSQTERHGAEIVLEGETFDEALACALRMAEERGLTFVPPFDDPLIVAGAGTVALEMLAAEPELDTLLVPIGGGGLIAGMAVAARALKPGLEIVGVQAELFPSMFCKINGQQLPCVGDTIAEGIAVKRPGVVTGEIVDALVDDILLVSERDLETAVSLLIQLERTVAEGAGGAGLAALLAYPDRFKGRKVGVVVTGGNIDTRLLATVLMRDLARQGRMTRLRIQIHDRPGAMFRVVRLFEQNKVNIIEINHQRIFTRLPAKDAFIEIECEARDTGQLDRLVEDIRAAGYNVDQVEIA